MVCPSCGKEVAETDAKCGSCGGSLSPNRPASTESHPCASAADPPRRPERQSLQNSSKAIASLALGLLPIVLGAGLLALVFGAESATLNPSLYYLGLVAALLAVIFGHGAKASIRRSSGRLRGKGVAIAGLVLGYLWLAGSILVIVISSFIDHSRLLANQASAVGSLRTINSAAMTYESMYNHGYPATLAVLGPPLIENPDASVRPSEKAAGLIDEYLASGRKSNYRFTYIPGPAGSTGKITTYAVHADPLEPGNTGKMYYFTDQTSVIRGEKGKEANENSPPIE